MPETFRLAVATLVLWTVPALADDVRDAIEVVVWKKVEGDWKLHLDIRNAE